ncbi:MAG: hypothetical protein M1837_006591 [Sclerophora amabilis]|nr:MAG: hypothetical protein M1837_006591 [Sclerophora amabilis]
MSLFRLTPRITSPLIRTLPGHSLRSSSSPALTRGYAHSGYGDGSGDPKGGKPQDQGANTSADLEHPGPPPPSEGHGSGSGPTKGSSTGHNVTQESDPGSSGKEPTEGSSTGHNDTQKSDSGSSGKESGGGSQTGAQPKIHDERGGPSTEGTGVHEHNEEQASRPGAAYNKLNQEDAAKVDKGFWRGQGGRDSDP